MTDEAPALVDLISALCRRPAPEAAMLTCNHCGNSIDVALALGTIRRHPSHPPLKPDYTPDEIEFLLAMDAYKRRQHRPFPHWSEVLGVLLALGYRK